MPTRECGPNGRKPSTEFQMRNTTFTSSVAGALLFGGTLGGATAANAAVLDLSACGTTGTVTPNATVGGRSNVLTMGGPYSTMWGSATGGTNSYAAPTSGFGMQQSGNAGMWGWAGTQGALFSDITGASFDWYNHNAAQGLGGGYRLYIKVYSTVAEGYNVGVLFFDLSYLAPNQVGQQWNSTGNYLTGATGSGIYYNGAGSNPFGTPEYNNSSSYYSLAQFQTSLAGWSVNQIGIMNDTGMTVSIDNFAVTYVPAPGAAALIGLAGAFMGRRRRA